MSSVTIEIIKKQSSHYVQITTSNLQLVTTTSYNALSFTGENVFQMQEFPTAENITLKANCKVVITGKHQVNKLDIQVVHLELSGELKVQELKATFQQGARISPSGRLEIHRRGEITCINSGMQINGLLIANIATVYFNGRGFVNNGICAIGKLKFQNPELSRLYREYCQGKIVGSDYLASVSDVKTYHGALENLGIIQVDHIEGEVSAMRLMPDSQTHVKQSGRLKNLGETMIYGIFINLFEFYYQAIGKTIIYQQGVWVSHNRLEVKSHQPLQVDGALCSRVWFKAYAQILGKGIIGSRGYTFLNGIKHIMHGELFAGTHLDLQFLELVNSGRIRSPSVFMYGKKLVTSGSIEGDISQIKAQERFIGLPNSKTVANELSISSGIVENYGLSEASIKAITTSHMNMVPTTLSSPSLIGAREVAHITAKQLTNSGLIVSYGWLNIQVLEKITNLLNAYIFANSLDFSVDEVLVNAGRIVSQSGLKITASSWMRNLATGKISSHKLESIVKQIDNHGELSATTAMLKVLSCIHQFATGKISTTKALHILAADFINEGLISCCENIAIDVLHVIHNKGKLTSQQSISIICGCIIRNSGEIKAMQKIRLIASGVMQGNLSTYMQPLVEFMVENLGTISGKEIDIDTAEFQQWIREYNLSANILFENMVSGIITATEAINIASNKVINRGSISCAKKLFIKANEVLNLGTMASNTKISILCALAVENFGKIYGNEQLQIIAKDVLQQQANGELVSAEKVQIIVQQVLINSGMISGQDIELDAGETASNLVGGDIQADRVSIRSEDIVTSGTIKSKHAELYASSVLHITQTGLLSADDLLDIEVNRLQNESAMSSLTNIFISARSLISNRGNITAKEMRLICASVIENSGNIKSLKKLRVNAERLLTLSDSEISSDGTAELLLEFALNNSGVLSGRDIRIISKDPNVLEVENHATGVINADKLAVIASQQITNNGKIIVSSATIDAMDFINSGVFQATFDVSIDCKNTIQMLRQGSLTVGGALDLIAQQRVILGSDIIAHKLLSITTSVLEQKQANIMSKQDILMKVTDWLMQGDVKSARNLLIKVTNDWQWEGDFDAKVSACLELYKDREIDRDITTTGDLQLTTKANTAMQLLSSITAGGNIKLVNGVYTVGEQYGQFARIHSYGALQANVQGLININGGLYGKKGLDISSSSQPVISGDSNPNGCYLVSDRDSSITSPYGFFNRHAVYDVKKHADINLGGPLHNRSGQVRLGSGKIQAEVINDMLMQDEQGEIADPLSYARSKQKSTTRVTAKTQQPIFYVSSNLDMHGNFNSHGGTLNVGGDLTFHSGGFIGVSYEAFENLIINRVIRGKRRYGICGPKRTHIQRVKQHNTHAVYHGAVNTKGNFKSHDLGASFRFPAANVSGAMDIDFAEVYVPYDTSMQSVQRVTNLGDYYRASQLFTRTSDDKYGFKPLFPIDCIIPGKVAVIGDDMDVPSLYHPVQEALFVSIAKVELLGVIDLAPDLDDVDILSELINKGLDYEKQLGRRLSQSDLNHAPYPMVVYEVIQYEGVAYKQSKLVLPQGLKKQLGVKAKSAVWRGDIDSLMQVSSKVEIQEEYDLTVGRLDITQQHTIDYEIVSLDSKARGLVEVRRLVPYTGQVNAGRFNIHAKQFRQRGGMLYGKEDSALSAETMHIQAAREEYTQSNNRRHAIAPKFIPARIKSGDNLRMSSEQFYGAGVDFSCVGHMEIECAYSLVMRLLVEYCKLPESKRTTWIYSEMQGGVIPHTLGNSLKAGKISVTSTWRTELENIVFDTMKRVMVVRTDSFSETHLNPQPHLYRTKQLNLVSELALTYTLAQLAPVIGKGLFGGFKSLPIQRFATGALLGGVKETLARGNVLKATLYGGMSGITSSFANRYLQIFTDAGSKQIIYGGKFMQNIGTSLMSAIFNSKDPSLYHKMAQDLFICIGKTIITEGDINTLLRSLATSLASSAGEHFSLSKAVPTDPLLQSSTNREISKSSSVDNFSLSKVPTTDPLFQLSHERQVSTKTTGLKARIGYGSDGKEIYVVQDSGYQKFGRYASDYRKDFKSGLSPKVLLSKSVHCQSLVQSYPPASPSLAARFFEEIMSIIPAAEASTPDNESSTNSKKTSVIKKIFRGFKFIIAAQEFNDPLISSAAAVRESIQTLEDQYEQEFSYFEGRKPILNRDLIISKFIDKAYFPGTLEGEHDIPLESIDPGFMAKLKSEDLSRVRCATKEISIFGFPLSVKPYACHRTDISLISHSTDPSLRFYDSYELGLNLISEELNSKLGNTKIEVDGPNFSLSSSIQAGITHSFKASIEGKAQLGSIKVNHDSPPICIDKHCLNLSASAKLGLGYGATIGTDEIEISKGLLFGGEFSPGHRRVSNEEVISYNKRPR